MVLWSFMRVSVYINGFTLFVFSMVTTRVVIKLYLLPVLFYVVDANQVPPYSRPAAKLESTWWVSPHLVVGSFALQCSDCFSCLFSSSSRGLLFFFWRRAGMSPILSSMYVLAKFFRLFQLFRVVGLFCSHAIFVVLSQGALTRVASGFVVRSSARVEGVFCASGDILIFSSRDGQVRRFYFEGLYCVCRGLVRTSSSCGVYAFSVSGGVTFV